MCSEILDSDRPIQYLYYYQNKNKKEFHETAFFPCLPKTHYFINCRDLRQYGQDTALAFNQWPLSIHSVH